MLARLQQALETIYGFRCAQHVEDYVVSPGLVSRLEAPPRAREELLIRESPEGLELGLFLRQDILERLPDLEADAQAGLLEELLDIFAVAAEGVSHFLFVARRAAEELQVSLLELELQAEVDKFALGVLHLWKKGQRRLAGELRHRLFEQIGYRGDLDPDERSRYETANRLARDYAGFLDKKYVASDRLEGLLRDLRRSYRFGPSEKLAYLGATQRA